MFTADNVPKYHELMNPLLQALHNLGGSGSIDEIFQEVTKILNLSEEVLAVLHKPGKSSLSRVEYNLAWARTYLKKFAIIDNSARGIWTIVPEKRNVNAVDPQEVVRTVRAMSRRSEVEEEEEAETWRDELYRILTQEVSPDGFERLAKRILRESGFTQVEVTGKSGDGGIDGKGIMKIGGLMSFHVVFQCKRYQRSVSASDIRDFRGAMIGRADKGLFITTGTFTRDAVQEAIRDGAPPLDLVDGDQLADKLLELALGVKTEIVEEVVVDQEWFKGI